MSRTTIVLAAIAIATLMLVASADATPKRTTFVSKRYRYSLVLPGSPGRWVEADALGNWSGDRPPNADFDRLTDVKTGHWWLVAAKRVPEGMTLKRWTAYTVSRMDPSCRPLAWHSKSKLGGAPAARYDLRCKEGRAIDTTAPHAHRGYFFICMPKNGTWTRLAAQRVCGTMRRSFHYTSR